MVYHYDDSGNVVDMQALSKTNCPSMISKIYVNDLTLELYSRLLVEETLQKQLHSSMFHLTFPNGYLAFLDPFSKGETKWGPVNHTALNN